jgi:RNA polymerase sigma-70 factor, ECF subfamily
LACIDPVSVENGCLEIADAPRFGGLIGEEWRPRGADHTVRVRTAYGDIIAGDISYLIIWGTKLDHTGLLFRMDNPSAKASSADPDVCNAYPPDTPAGDSVGDLSLVRCAQAGESGAFDRLVVKYRPLIVALAMRYTRNHADAEDATQEAFLRAYRGLRHFRGRSAFYTWLYRIASNCARSLLSARSRGSHISTIDLQADPDADSPPMQLKELETPEELMLTDEIRGMVNVTLAGLSEEHRTISILRKIEGLSYRDIAAAMSIPVGTVRSRVFRARDRIDLQLRRVYDGGLGRHVLNGRAARASPS